MFKKTTPAQEDQTIDTASSAVTQTNQPAHDATPDYDNMNPHERREFDDRSLEEFHKKQEDSSIVNMFLVASKTSSILEAKVEGVHVEGKEISWVCYYGPVVVHIPFAKTFEGLPDALLDPTTPDLLTRRRQFLTKSIGITIPFIVTSFITDPNGDTITIGSRIDAIRRIRRRYFGRDAKKPVKKGDVLEAQVLNVGPSALRLHVKGMDVRVPNRLMSHRWLSDMQLVYAAGDKVTVQVTDLREDPATGNIQLAVSCRPIELEKAKRLHSRLRKGNIYGATIIHVRSAPTMHVSLWLEGIEVPGYAATTGLFKADSFRSGDHVYVEVLGVTETGYVHTKILPHKKAGRR